MPTQSISFNNANTKKVLFNGGAGNKEVCYVKLNGTEIWRKNTQANDLQTGNLTPAHFSNSFNGYGRSGYISRFFPSGIGSGAQNRYISTSGSEQPGTRMMTGQSRGAIQLFNRGRGFTSGSAVENFLNAGTHPWNKSALGHTFVWKNCLLDANGGISNINIGDAYSSGIGSRTWGYIGGDNNTSFSNGNYGDYEDDQEEDNYEISLILGNRGTILLPFHRFTWGTGTSNVVTGDVAIWNYFGRYGSSRNAQTQGRTQSNLPSDAYTENAVYVNVVSTFGSQHSSRSDVTNFGGMLLKDFVQKSHEFTGFTCGESFAKIRILGSEGGGSAD